jgi:hypothetical protein
MSLFESGGKRKIVMPHYYKQNMFYPHATCPYTYHEGSVDIASRILNLSTSKFPQLHHIILSEHGSAALC